MLSDQEYAKWRLRIESAADRYQTAKLRVGETAIDRLTLPAPDGGYAHSRALHEETLALRAYADLLMEYSRLMLESEPHEH